MRVYFVAFRCSREDREWDYEDGTALILRANCAEHASLGNAVAPAHCARAAERRLAEEVGSAFVGVESPAAPRRTRPALADAPPNP
jgi:hypothetical protein